MDSETIYRLRTGLLTRCHNNSMLDTAMSQKNRSRRIGMVMSIIRSSLSQAPIGVFNGVIYGYNSKIYEVMSQKDFYTLIYETVECLGLPFEDMLMVDKIEKACRSVVMKKEIRPMSDYVVFQNCVYDIRRKKEFAFSARYVQMSRLDYEHNGNMRPYMWMTFLDEVLPDKKKQLVLQEFLGSIFIDRQEAKMEKMLILLGDGANGKSVVFETVLGVLGRENVTNFGLQSLIAGTERKHNIATINGKRLNYCSEIQAIEIGKDSDALKTLVSGEPTEARALYGQNFMARDIPLLMSNANRMPYLTDMSVGMRRRLCIIRFGITIPKEKQNTQLAEQLKAEYPGIFNWMIEGRDRFIQNGYKLTHYQTTETTVEEFLQSTNTVIQYMADAKYYPFDFKAEDKVPVWRTYKTIYDNYVAWCQGNDTIPETRRSMAFILKKQGYRKRRMSTGTEYAVFGKKGKKDTTVPAFKKVIKQTPDLAASFWHDEDGAPIILGAKRLASAAGVAYKIVARFAKEGLLDCCCEEVNGGWRAYNLEKCKRVFFEQGIYKSHNKMEQMRSERAKMAQNRKAFNDRMISLGLPYRKMKHRDRTAAGCVWVPDVFTVEEAMLQEGKGSGEIPTMSKIETTNTNNK